jgi:hypothetical protein
MGASGDTTTVPSGASLVVASGATINITGATQTGFPSSGLNSVQTFTSGGTWTKPAGVTKVIVEVQGAGGSGANRISLINYAVGGAAGGYAKKLLDVTDTTSATVTIGAGGPAQATGNTGGTAGGLSKFEENVGTGGWTDVIGNGGAAGGEAVIYATSTGGTGTGGDINIQGQYGTTGGSADRSGNSMLGFGNKIVQTGQTTAVPSTGYGAGGGGSMGVTSTAGTGGIVIVWEYK